ncbi:hypothetical protein GIB67_014406 [Kingdonia uniflora]|uniref:Probable 6-phosphogluconolactonase n=1 Tax=Kingdonia uniflora TaxID=39325 RepID=A0A7J7LYU7_9MAGN|nr:hypothetical protein GIB67_014406 [Kingdonia uniflora]
MNVEREEGAPGPTQESRADEAYERKEEEAKAELLRVQLGELRASSKRGSRRNKAQSKSSNEWLTSVGMEILSASEQLGLDSILYVPIPPGNVYAINDALLAEGAADDYETCLKQLVKANVVDVSATSGFPKFDLMLLGMGPDGHVASLFPGHALLKENERWVTFITESPKPPPERITFTFPVINSSAYIAFVVAGSGKADVVRRVFGKEESSDKLPVQMVSTKDGATTWFVDKEAASKL